MFSMTFVGIMLWFTYGMLRGDLPLILANAVTMVLVGAVVVAKLRFG
jgi:MtN3 and saliva related transmembrane protein